ncbi:hypothetical protein EJB05_09519, partial [Eragrostis curvula]
LRCFCQLDFSDTGCHTGLIMVDLVKYYVVFPVLPAFMEWGRKGYFQTQRSKTVMTAVLTVRSGLDPHMIRDGWMDGWRDMVLAGSHLDAASGWTTLKTMVKTKLVEPPVDCLWRYGVFR